MEKKNTHIMYGLITGIAMVIVGVSIYIAGAAFVKGMNYVSYIPLLAGTLLNAIAFSKANNGYVTFGNVFGSGFKLAMVASLIMIAWGFLQPLVFPDLKEKAMNMVREKMSQNPKITEDQIEAYLSMSKKYWNVFMIGGILLGNLFLGAIFSLIGGAIAEKKGQLPLSADNF